MVTFKIMFIMMTVIFYSTLLNYSSCENTDNKKDEPAVVAFCRNEIIEVFGAEELQNLQQFVKHAVEKLKLKNIDDDKIFAIAYFLTFKEYLIYKGVKPTSKFCKDETAKRKHEKTTCNTQLEIFTNDPKKALIYGFYNTDAKELQSLEFGKSYMALLVKVVDVKISKYSSENNHANNIKECTLGVMYPADFCKFSAEQISKRTIYFDTEKYIP